MSAAPQSSQPDHDALRQALDEIETQMNEMRSLKGWRMNLIRESLAKARAAAPPAAQTDGVRESVIEECAKLIESGAGMADLIDQDDLDQQAKYIRGLALTRPERQT